MRYADNCRVSSVNRVITQCLGELAGLSEIQEKLNDELTNDLEVSAMDTGMLCWNGKRPSHRPDC